MLKPYPDELLIGLIGRYHLYSGRLSFKESVHKLYGLGSVRPSLHLPSHLQRLATHGPFGKSAEELIVGHTLFPYYQSFLEPKVAQGVFNDMIQDRSLGIHTESGLVASRVPLPTQITYCPRCMEEDIQIYGEPYLHRVHHIPGVKVCPKHHVKLYGKCPVCGESLDQRAYQEFPYLMTKCPNGHSLLTFEYSQNPLLIRFATDSEYILNNVTPWNSLDELRDRYINGLYAMGLATPSGYVRQNELFERFTSSFSSDFWIEIGVERPIRDKEWNWLRELVRKPKKALHPIFHITMMEFLSGDIPRFFVQPVFAPFGHGPWPCLNKDATHYMENVVKKLIITICTETRLPVGTFSCDCGFVYSRRGPDQSDNDRHRYGRIKEFGHVWEEKLHKLVSGNYLNLRGLAREMGTDSKVIVSKLRQSESVYSNEDCRATSELDIRRKRLQYIIETNQILTRTQLRQENHRDYTWLYRHDRDWLEEVLPPPAPNALYHKSQRVNWEKRDLETSLSVEQAVQTILTRPGKPLRLTIGRIGRVCGNKSLLEKCLHKLPVTAKILKDFVESINEFQKRRVDWAINELWTRGETIAEWKVVRIAGLKSPITRDVCIFLHERMYDVGATKIYNENELNYKDISHEFDEVTGFISW